jgi:microcompartment protein CcmL/EutN
MEREPAIAVVELVSIARGIIATDAMCKKAPVTLEESAVICPGKYLIIISGPVGPVEEAWLRGLEIGGDAVVDRLFLPNAHTQLVPAMRALSKVEEVGALAVVETFAASSAILAADASCKRAAVTLIELRLARGMCGKGMYTMTGALEDVEAAVEAGEQILEAETGLLLRSEIIPRPHPDLIQKLL